MGALTRNAAGPESGGANGHGGGSNASAVLELVANLSLREGLQGDLLNGHQFSVDD